ncbi:hypothetical protein [Paracoccus mutanolyticus]|uniref:hypothetical protein n=1 Tax=Paracoccus mutanolyticus TaxID=1499308 RepID=UPI00167C4345|nr:hypothetical protein [Paracoccus mutanolyticus]
MAPRYIEAAERHQSITAAAEALAVSPSSMPPPSITSRRNGLSLPGSKARDRGSLGVSEFKRLAVKAWPA